MTDEPVPPSPKQRPERLRTPLVHESPAALGKKMGRLEFGTAVRVVKEEGAFTLVEWRGENDTLLAGWVFTRYLKKFK